jgi:hypothetical protein
LLAVLVKVTSNGRHNLRISHPVGCHDTGDAAAEGFFLQTFAQLAFRLAGARIKISSSPRMHEITSS